MPVASQLSMEVMDLEYFSYTDKIINNESKYKFHLYIRSYIEKTLMTHMLTWFTYLINTLN